MDGFASGNGMENANKGRMAIAPNIAANGRSIERVQGGELFDRRGLAGKTTLAMIYKLIKAAQMRWYYLDDRNQLAKAYRWCDSRTELRLSPNRQDL